MTPIHETAIREQAKLRPCTRKGIEGMTPEKMPSEVHEDFIKAVVALARQHGMDGLTFSFRTSFDKRMRGLYDGTVNVAWSEGRHGERNRINVRFESHIGIDEAEPTP